MRARTRLTLLLLLPAALWGILAEPPRPAVLQPAAEPKTLPVPAFVRLGTPDELPLEGVYNGTVFPDGSRFVLVSGHTMHIVDTRTRIVLKTWPVGGREAHRVTVSPDGKGIAYAGGHIHIIDADTGKQLREVQPHIGGVTSVAYSPDGRLLLTCGSEVDWSLNHGLLDVSPRSSCKVWDATTLAEHPATRGGLIGTDPAWHPNGREFTYRAVVGDIRKNATESRVQPLDGRPAEAFVLRGADGTQYIPAAFSPSGRLVVGYGEAGGAVFDWAARKLLLNMDAERKPGVRIATVACIAADDDTIYSSDGTGTIRVRSLAAGGGKAFAWQHLPYPQLTLSGDGRTLFAHTWNYGVLPWDTATGRAVGGRAGHRAPVIAADISPDGRLVVTGSLDTTARVWDRASGRELRAFEGHAVGVYRVAFLADNRTAVSVDADGVAKVWDTETGAETRSVALGTWSGLVVSPGRNLLAFGAGDHIRFRTLPELAERDLIPLALRQATPLVFTPDGRGLDFRSAYPDDRKPKPPYYAFHRWDLEAGREVLQVESWPGIELLSPDGDTFVGHVGPWGNHALAAWDRASGREHARLESLALAFSGDGRRLLTTTIQGNHIRKTTFTIYDTRTWQPVASLHGHASMVHAAAFSNDGRFVVTSSSDGTAIVWNLAASAP